MGKVSFLHKDAQAGGGDFTIQSGDVEIIGCKARIRQYPPSKKAGKEGQQQPPMCIVQVEFQKIDGKTLEHLADSEPLTIDFKVGDPEKFHPGQAKSADDQEPQDLGSEIDTEGNCIVSVEGALPSVKAKWIHFTKSLEDQGFKPEVLGNGFLPDLIGLKAHIDTKKLDKFQNDKGQEFEPTVNVVDRKPYLFPYDAKKGGKGKNASTAATSGTSTTANTAASGGKANGAAAPEFDAPAFVLAQAQVIAKENAGKELTKGEFGQAVLKKILKVGGIQPKYHKSITDYSKSDEGIAALAGEGLLEYVMNEAQDAITGVKFA